MKSYTNYDVKFIVYEECYFDCHSIFIEDSQQQCLEEIIKMLKKYDINIKRIPKYINIHVLAIKLIEIQFCLL